MTFYDFESNWAPIFSAMFSGNEMLQCDFNTEKCDGDVRSNWVYNKGPTPTPDTGPMADHTSRNGVFIVKYYIKSVQFPNVPNSSNPR